MATTGKGIKIGKYDVVDTIGRGGMGVVYLAKDPYLDRLVAIKMMNVDVHESGDFLERFYREAKSTASLQHPNIVTVYELGEHQGRPFLVMQYLEGSSLEALLRTRHPMSLLDKLNVVIEVCQGLSYAHHRGIIHRDIKPANIMVLNDGGVKIVDFGIARLGDQGLTRTGQFVGSLYYMPPEYFSDKGIDTRTDVYATGVVLYQLLTYALPFEGESTQSTLAKIISEEPPPFRQFGVSYPSELEAITFKALSKNRDQRFASAEAFAAALAEVQDGLKQTSIAEYLDKADLLQQSNELVQAQEYLLRAHRLDRQNTAVARRLGVVRSKLQSQLSAERVVQLTKQADEALAREDFDTSLTFVKEAIELGDSQELQALKAVIQHAKAEAEVVRKAIAQAEAAQRSGDLDAAYSAIEAAFSYRPNDSKIKAIRRAITRDLEERERQKKLDSVLDEARKHMAERRFTDALDLLKEAQQLDASAPQLRALLDKLAVQHKREKHRRRIEQINHEVQQAIDRDDYAAASAKSSEGLQEFPAEPNLVRLKELADAQLAIAAQRDLVRAQIAAAEQLLDGGQTQEALVTIEAALERAAGNSRLESFRTMLRERLAKELAEADKATCLQQANDAIRLGRYADAIRILETAQVRFVESSGVDELLRFARDQQAKHEQQKHIEEARQRAQQLVAEQHFEEAVQVLEKAVERVPSEDLRILLHQARGRQEAYRRELQVAIAKGKSFVAEGAAASAIEFLSSLPASYQQSAEFRDLQLQAQAAARTSKREATAAAATQMFVGSQAEPAKLVPPADSAEATKVFAPAAPTKAATARPPILQEPTVQPQPVWSEAAPPRSKKPWVLLSAVAAAVVILGVGLLLWWISRPSYLVVKAPHGAEIAIDGAVSTGVESADGTSFKVKPGKHSVQVTENGYQPWSQNITVQGGERPIITAALTPPPPPPPPPVPPSTWPVVITSNVDGASAFVDGNFEDSFGNTKKLTLHLSEGSHAILLKKTGYEDSLPQRVDVSAKGKEKQLAFTLKKATAAIVATDADLVIRAKPGASIRVDNVVRNVDPRGFASMKVNPGIHSVQVELQGYEAWSTTVNLQAGNSKTVTAELKILPALPVTRSEPPPPPVAPPAAPSPAPTAEFTASQETIHEGETATLRWQTENATDVSIDGHSVSPSGSRSVSPTSTTTYTLLASGAGGKYSASQVIVVQPKITPTVVEPPVVKIDTGEAQAVKEVLEQYKAAYRDMTPDAFKIFWPTIPDKKLKFIKEEFNTDKALGVTEACQGEPSISGDTAQWTCVETKAHTVDGKREKRPAHTILFQFKKANGRWYMSGQSVQ